MFKVYKQSGSLDIEDQSLNAGTKSASSMAKVLLGTAVGACIGAAAFGFGESLLSEGSSISSPESVSSVRKLEQSPDSEEFPGLFNARMEERNIDSVFGLFDSINDQTLNVTWPNFYANESEYGLYMQHNPGTPDGNAPVVDLIMSFPPGQASFAVDAVLAEGDLAICKFHAVIFGMDFSVLDVFKFNDEGKLIEHWDSTEPLLSPENTESGNAMFPISETGRLPTSEDTYMNRRTAIDAVSKYWNYDLSAVDTYFSEDYIEHSATGGNGRDGLKATIQGLLDEGVNVTMDIGGVIAYGDYVSVFIKLDYNGWEEKPTPVLTDNFFKFEDGVIVEHWDISQLEIRPADTVSGRAMFPRY